MSFPCECASWCLAAGPESGGKHHHKNCPKYATEKFPCLLYWEEGVDAWVPVPVFVENMIEAQNLSEGDVEEIRFKRIDLTDKEFDEIPEE